MVLLFVCFFVLGSAVVSGDPASAGPKPCRSSNVDACKDNDHSLIQRNARASLHHKHGSSITHHARARLETIFGAASEAGAQKQTTIPIWTAVLLVILLIAAGVQFFRLFFVPDGYVGPTEKDALENMNDSEVLAKMKDDQASADFRLMLEMSIRSAVFAFVGGLPRIAPDLFEYFGYMGWAPGGIVVFIVFNLSSSLGGTLLGVMNALLGTLFSILFIWIPTLIYPGGYHEVNSDACWYFGVFWLVATVCFMLIANFPDGVKVWCLIFHVGNMMTFLNSDASAHGIIMGAFGGMLMNCIGATVAIIGTCLPYPFMESRKAVSGLHKTTILFRVLLNDVVKTYTGDGVTAFDKGGAITAQLRDATNALGANAGSSWYEHYDWSAYTRHALLSHKDIMLKLVYHVSCIQKAMGGAWEPQPDGKEKLVTLQQKIEGVMDTCAEVIEGTANRKDIKVDELEAAINDLPEAASGSASAVVFLLRSLGEASRDYGNQVKQLDSRNVAVDYVYWSVIMYWCRVFGLDSSHTMAGTMAHINAALRYIITILFCFTLGYHGYGDVVPSYSAGIALNAAFLLGSVPGSALSGNMKKFQGIVLGTAGGQLIFPLTHAAAGLGPAVIGVALFVYIFVTSLIKFGSAEWALTGMLLGVFGSGQMLAAPGAAHDAKAVQAELAGAYSGIIQAVISILTMTVVDIILAQPLLGKEDPKISAMKAYKSFLDSVQSVLVGLMGSGKPRDKATADQVKKLLGRKTDLLKYVEGIGGQLNTMDSFVSIAAQSSPMGLYEGLSASGRGALDDLWILAGAVADKGSEALKDDLSTVLEAMSQPSDMFDDICSFLEGRGQDGVMHAPSCFQGLEIVQSEKENMSKAPADVTIGDPVVGYAVSHLLTLKKQVWDAAKGAA